MEEKKLAPKRRFKGFEGEWRTYNLGEKVEFFSGLTYSPSNVVSKGGTLVIRSSNIKNNQIIDADNVFVDKNIVNSEQVKFGDIIVVVRNGSRNLIGKNAVVRKEMPDTVIGAFMTGIRSKYYDFNNTLLNTKLFKRQVAENLGATINQITTGMFKKMEFNFPKVEEQQKIGEFFKVLDERISNQERKIAKVKALKSAYLTEMFPQDGETVPKRRFKGFEGEWSRFKLEDLAEISTGYAFSSNQFNSNGKYLVVTNKNIKDQDKGIVSLGDRIDIHDKDMIEKLKLNGINVLVTMDGVNIGETGKYTDDIAVLAQRVGRLNSDRIEFIYQITKKNKFKLEMNRISVGNAIKHISLSQIADYSFLAPKLKEEQQKIGKFFKNLDNQITTEEKKLEKLKKMKEAYLEEMFV